MYSNNPSTNESGICDTGPEQVLKVQISYVKMWPKYPWSLSPPHHLFSPSLHLPALKECLTISWQRKWKLRPGLQRDLHDMQGITWKWTAVTLQPLSGTALKDSGEEKSSLWAELQAVHQAVHFAWKEKLPDMQLNTNAWAMVNSLSRRSGS